jgi:AcrR family transcriptional regulator
MGGGSRRYKKTEEAILTVFFDNPSCTINKLAKKAGIARSTFYTHHHSARDVSLDLECDILENYLAEIKRRLKMNDIYIKSLYLDTLIFITKNRQFFKMFNNREVVRKMLFELRQKVREPEKIFRIYISEVTEIIFEWGERGFMEEEIEKVLADIMYLTITARERLAPLA